MELCAKANWEPDSSSKYCRGCSKSFGFALRRSHCRVCGKVYCGDCVHHLDFSPCGTGPSESVKACRKCILAHAAFCEEVRQNGGLPPETSMVVETDVTRPPECAPHEETLTEEDVDASDSTTNRTGSAAIGESAAHESSLGSQTNGGGVHAADRSLPPSSCAETVDGEKKGHDTVSSLSLSVHAAGAEDSNASVQKSSAATAAPTSAPARQTTVPASTTPASSSPSLSTKHSAPGTAAPVGPSPLVTTTTAPPPPPLVLMDKRKWEQDSHAARCNDCNVGFTFHVRRSHCRLCGRVFCKSCVQGVSLPEVAPTEPIKVCRDCNKSHLQPRGRSAFETSSQVLHGMSELQSSDDDEAAAPAATHDQRQPATETAATVLQQDSGAFAKTDHVSKIKFCGTCGKILQPGTKTCFVCNPPPPVVANSSSTTTSAATPAADADTRPPPAASGTPPSAQGTSDASPTPTATISTKAGDESTAQSTAANTNAPTTQGKHSGDSATRKDSLSSSSGVENIKDEAPERRQGAITPPESESSRSEQPVLHASTANTTTTNTTTTSTNGNDAGRDAAAPGSSAPSKSVPGEPAERSVTTPPATEKSSGSPAGSTAADASCPVSPPLGSVSGSSFASSATLNGSVVLSDGVIRSRTASIRQDTDGAKLVARCARFLEGCEVIIRVQSLSKTRYLRTQTRILVLTTLPRLFYVDEGNVLRGSLPLSVGCGTVKLDGAKGFVITMKQSDGQSGKTKDYTFATATPEDAGAWVADLASIMNPA